MSNYEEWLGLENPPTDPSAVEMCWSGSSGSTTGSPVEANSETRQMLKRLLFDLIRPLFVKNIGADEEFICEVCKGPILRRTVFCSSRCHNTHMDNWVRRFKPYQ